MKHLMSLLCFAGASLLAACGGGEDKPGSGQAAPAGAVAYVAGDSVTYSYATTWTPAGGSATSSNYHSTTYFDSIAADGTYNLVVLSSSGSLLSNISSKNGQQTNYSYTSGGIVTSCLNSPQVDAPPATLSVGTSWNLSYTRTCMSGGNVSSVSTNTNVGSVVASEPYTIGTWTFDTYKLVFTTTSSTSGGGTSQSAVTCWRDKTLNRNVACDSTSTHTAAGSSTPTATSTAASRVSSLIVAGYGSNKKLTDRFAGSWNVNWTGGTSGACAIVINSGLVSGTCTPTGDVSSYSVTGTVDVNGAVTATVTSLSTTLTGTMPNPKTGSGSWTGGGFTGTWSAAHI